MRKNGFLAVRAALALCLVLVLILWAGAQLDAPAARAEGDGGLKDYLVAWSGPSNVWLAAGSGFSV